MKRDREATCYNPHDPMSKRIYGVEGLTGVLTRETPSVGSRMGCWCS